MTSKEQLMQSRPLFWWYLINVHFKSYVAEQKKILYTCYILYLWGYSIDMLKLDTKFLKINWILAIDFKTYVEISLGLFFHANQHFFPILFCFVFYFICFVLSSVSFTSYSVILFIAISVILFLAFLLRFFYFTFSFICFFSVSYM